MTEAERIKNRLRDCTTPKQIAQVADEERAAVKALAVTDRTFAIQIANLKSYLLKMMEG